MNLFAPVNKRESREKIQEKLTELNKRRVNLWRHRQSIVDKSIRKLHSDKRQMQKELLSIKRDYERNYKRLQIRIDVLSRLIREEGASTTAIGESGDKGDKKDTPTTADINNLWGAITKLEKGVENLTKALNTEE